MGKIKKAYRTIEYVVSFEGSVPVGAENVRLTTAKANAEEYSSAWMQLDSAQQAFIEYTTEINCLANDIPGLAENTTIVHIPARSIDGKKLTYEHTQLLFWQVCGLYGRPTHSGSSLKGRTLYMVKRPFAEELASMFKDAYTFDNYLSIIWSSTTSGPIDVIINKIYPATRGRDGNCPVNTELWGRDKDGPLPGCQTRGIQLSDIKANSAKVRSTEKGTGTPEVNADGWELNTSQVKFMAGTGRGKWTFRKNENVNTNLSISWFAPQITMLLKNTPEVQKRARSRIKKALDKHIIPILTDPVKRALARGALHYDEKTMTLNPPRSAIEEAFRCKLDNCIEVEERSGRMLVRKAAKIVLSGGDYGHRSMVCMDDKTGVSDISREKAIEILDRGEEVYMGYRDPCNGPKRICFFDKWPYKKGHGFVFTAKTAAKMNADADGDTVNMSKDQKTIRFYAENLRDDLDIDDRPLPVRREAPMDWDKVEDIILNQFRTSWMIGTLTEDAWKFDTLGMTKEASTAFLYADVAPMLLKHEIWIGGKKFEEAVDELINPHRKLLEDTVLQWHDADEASEGWNSVRQFADSFINNPVSLLDVLWNAGCEHFHKWLDENKLYELSLSKIGHTIFDDFGRIPGHYWVKAHDDFIDPWGVYWAKFRNDDGSFVAADHRKFFKDLRKKAMKADIMTLAAVLCWRPRSNISDGFGLKWQVLFATGRAHELLGYHPDIKAYMKKKGVNLAKEEFINQRLKNPPAIAVKFEEEEYNIKM